MWRREGRADVQEGRTDVDEGRMRRKDEKEG